MGLLTLVSELATATVLAAYGSTMKLEDAELAWDVPFIASAAITLLAILAHFAFATDDAEDQNCRPPRGAHGDGPHPLSGRPFAAPLRAFFCSGRAWLLVGAMIALSVRELALFAYLHAYARSLPDGRGGSTQLLPLETLGTAAALCFGAPLYDRLRRAGGRGAMLLLGACCALQFVTVATWAALERHGQVGRAGLGALLVLTGLFNALPFHLPGPVAMIQCGGPEHAATIVSLVDALIIVSGLVIKAGLIDGVERASWEGWLWVQAALIAAAAALLTSFLALERSGPPD